MKMNNLLKKIEGIQSIESIKSTLGVDRKKAIYFVHRLRKGGYVLTKQDAHNVRTYFISQKNALGGTSYIDILNKYSPIKLSSAEVYKIYGREVSIEETIVYAIKTHKIRYILASLALYKKIKDWTELYRLAKRNDVVREIGALYELVEATLPRIKKVNKMFSHYGLPSRKDKYKYIIPNIKSKDYIAIEEKWRIYLAFNKIDLQEYLQ